MPPHDATSDVTQATSAEPAAPVHGSGGAVAEEPAAGGGLVDYRRTARRLRAGAAVLALVVLATWAGLAAFGDASVRTLVELAGLGLLGMLVLEVVVVGGAALRGMLAAGDRGERLAAGDVALVPPQLRRRGRR